ncbi:diacylglycerol kinase family protein [Streptomyces sp. NBC_01197]|uniref:diacylglycerol kinase family protein n=1 Tax=Streptomyces sp. NBC_01197 TaxID=2903768 RepID=UPI002E0E4070|nr:diacylglycerol kinase family protein [Streptomyces sp. NBC_01197]
MTSEITLFVNPTAGRGRGAHAAQPAASALRDAGFSVRTVLGSDAPDALRRAREAVRGGTGALIAVGGDGMISLALQAVAGTRTPLGVVAVGTGNDFARGLRLPVRDPAAAGRSVAAALKGGNIREIDLGRVVRSDGSGPGDGAGQGNGADPGDRADDTGLRPAGARWFGSVLAAGFDSRVNDRGNRMRRPAGRLKYDLAMVAELAAFRPLPYRLVLDGGPAREIEATLVAVGNGPSYGGGMKICAGAELDDGLLDITVVGACSRATLVRVFPKVYRGTHLSHPAVTSYRVRRIELRAAGITGYADGEPLGPLPLTAECVPRAVRVIGC